jgi:hypothetical protein
MESPKNYPREFWLADGGNRGHGPKNRQKRWNGFLHFKLSRQ